MQNIYQQLFQLYESGVITFDKYKDLKNAVIAYKDALNLIWNTEHCEVKIVEVNNNLNDKSSSDTLPTFNIKELTDMAIKQAFKSKRFVTRSEVSHLTGINERTLYRKLSELGITLR